MSLKAFHIVFVILTTATSLFVSGWSFNRFFAGSGSLQDLLMGAGGAVAAVSLVVYGRYVLKKLQHISYL